MQNTPTQAYTGYIYKVKTLHIIILGLFIYLSVLIVNDGFMALDEYWVGITRYIPAQSSSLMTLVEASDVKSPLQLLPMHAVAQMALYFGVNSPYAQYRIVIFVLGLISTLLLLIAFYKFAVAQKLNQYQTNLLFLVLFFHFAAPFSLTRPMFESVAAPWLALAGVFAYKYDISNKLKDLAWGVFFASIAFVLRQQLGFCALVFIILPVIKKNMRHVLLAASVGFLFFILSGIPDLFIRGGFHYSLINLTTYNYEHGAEYGNRSVLFYPVLILVVTFVPFFIKKYDGFDFKSYLLKNRSLIIIIFLFVFLHSLFPQKWERFVISVIPILMFLGFPFFYELCKSSHNNKKRLIILFLFNGVLFVIASFFPAQKNLIEMSRYLNINSQVKKVYRVADTPGWITEAFILNKNFIFIDSDRNQLLDVDWSDCSKNLVVGEAQAAYLNDVTKGLKLVTEFNVNLIEQLAFKMNPKNNLRRVQLKLYSGCGG